MEIVVIQGKSWGRVKDVKTQFCISKYKLEEIADKGYIRIHKDGDHKQAPRVYCFEDINQCLKYEAAGRKPPVMRGKTC